MLDIVISRGPRSALPSRAGLMVSILLASCAGTATTPEPGLDCTPGMSPCDDAPGDAGVVPDSQDTTGSPTDARVAPHPDADPSAAPTTCQPPDDTGAFTTTSWGDGQPCALGCQTGTQSCIEGVLHCDLEPGLAGVRQPGFLADPAGLERSHDLAYASAIDEYVVVYAGATPLVTRLSACGDVLDAIALDDVAPPGRVISDVSIAYNPDRPGYLVILRYQHNDDPAEVYGRFFDLSFQAQAPAFAIRQQAPFGGGFSAAYSPQSRRYLVRWGEGHNLQNYQLVDADPTAAHALIGEPTILAGDGTPGSAMKSKVAYGGGSGSFLAVYAVEQRGTNQSNVLGRVVSGDGETLGSPFTIADSERDETGPRLAYADASDRWLVTWQRHRDDRTGYEVHSALVDAQGNVTANAVVHASGPDRWDAPGPVAYVPQRNVFLVSWFIEGTSRVRIVDGDTGRTGDEVFTMADAVPSALAARTLGSSAQAVLIWGHEHQGVYAGFVTF